MISSDQEDYGSFFENEKKPRPNRKHHSLQTMIFISHSFIHSSLWRTTTSTEPNKSDGFLKSVLSTNENSPLSVFFIVGFGSDHWAVGATGRVCKHVEKTRFAHFRFRPGALSVNDWPHCLIFNRRFIDN